MQGISQPSELEECILDRLGFKITETKSVLESVMRSRVINRENIVVMSHLSSASASTTSSLITEQEIEKFDHYTKNLPFYRSLASSAAILNYPQSHYDWIRPGLLFYVVTPFVDRDVSSLDFKLVMKLEGKIISLNFCYPGDTVGYDKTWTCEKLTHIAIVNVGYVDGYPYHSSSLSKVFLRDQMVSIIGKVSSDAIAIDVTSVKNVCINDLVILWGKELPVEKVAQKADTVPDQLLCSPAQRYTRFL